MTDLKFGQYRAFCHDPKTGQDALFQITAASPGHADVQARDGFFGLLAPPSKERRQELEVMVEKC